MLEKCLGEEKARRLRASFMLLSIYESTCDMELELRRVERLISLSSNFLLVSFRGEISRLQRDLCRLMTELPDKNYVDLRSLEDLEDELIEKIRLGVQEIKESTGKLRNSLIEEIEFSMGILADIIERYPSEEGGSKLRFLSHRIRELSTKVEYLSSPYLEIFIAFILTYLPRVHEEVGDVSVGIESLRKSLMNIVEGPRLTLTSPKGVYEGTKDEARHLIKILDYLMLFSSRYPPLRPGIAKYLEEIEIKIFSPGGAYGPSLNDKIPE